MYRNITEGRFTFVDGRERAEEKRKIEAKHIEPELYPSNVYTVVTINNKSRSHLGAQAFENNGIFVAEDEITQKFAVQLPENQSVFIIQSSDLRPLFIRMIDGIY